MFDVLPPRQREAFQIRLNGHTHRAIAQIMGITRQAVGKLLRKARENLALWFSTRRLA